MNEFPIDRNKAEWRAWAKDRRRGMDYSTIAPLLLDRLTTLPEWQSARHVLLYLAMPEEFPVEAVAIASDGHYWYVPRCEKGRRLAVYPYAPGKTVLITGAFGLREPEAIPGTALQPERLDLVVLPALLFSEQGERLGYGGGYYDRFLPRLRSDCVTVGVMPEAMIVPALPVESHDAPVDVIVTEARTIRRADTTVPIPRPD